ncbi:hypothetical protein ACQKNB_20870 [Lysinibacillus xylanilyticus]|uniref:hypothetical protein n=1 Tax=Lysinibacillus xylanilyticus TaxID=582475 RepID=UPI003D0762A4
MSTTKLTIVPVILDPITDNSSSTTSPQNSPEPSCIILYITTDRLPFRMLEIKLLKK